MLPWKDAKSYCSERNATLLDFSDSEDLQYVKNLSHRDIWIGLRRNGPTFADVIANVSDVFTIYCCESANISGHSLRNVSCTKNLLSSVCEKAEGK